MPISWGRAVLLNASPIPRAGWPCQSQQQWAASGGRFAVLSSHFSVPGRRASRQAERTRLLRAHYERRLPALSSRATSDGRRTTHFRIPASTLPASRIYASPAFTIPQRLIGVHLRSSAVPLSCQWLQAENARGSVAGNRWRRTSFRSDPVAGTAGRLWAGDGAEFGAGCA